MKKKFVGVLGVGEIGLAIAKILGTKYQVFRRDLNYDEFTNNKIDFLHVCIPYNKNFHDVLIKTIKEVSPELTIIHSTIAVGSTRKIFQSTKLPVVHSPIRGIHPHLVRDIRKFIKYIGAVDDESAGLAARHLKSLGLKVELVSNPEETELGKLLDTTYYSWNIIFCKMVSKLCRELQLDFNNVYTKFNNTYNEGYRRTKPNVVRPVLKDIPGKIGGHCIINNAEILHHLYKMPLTELILSENEKFNEE